LKSNRKWEKDGWGAGDQPFKLVCQNFQILATLLLPCWMGVIGQWDCRERETKRKGRQGGIFGEEIILCIRKNLGLILALLLTNGIT